MREGRHEIYVKMEGFEFFKIKEVCSTLGKKNYNFT